MRLVVVGPQRTPAQIVALSDTVLVVAAQHGDEPAGREAALRDLRDHAASSSTRTLLYVPTANPDGFSSLTRNNSGGVDVNHDHDALLSVEANAIKAVFDTYAPKVTVDCHEYIEVGSAVQVLNTETTSASAGVRASSLSLKDEYVKPALVEAGFATADYASNPATEVLRNKAGVRGSAALLVETPRSGTPTPPHRRRGRRGRSCCGSYATTPPCCWPASPS